MPSLSLSPRENLLRAYRFEGPDWIPLNINLWPLRMAGYDQAALEGLMAEYPAVFPHYTPGMYAEDKLIVPPDMFPDHPYRDAWGCLWKTNYLGMVGAVVEHPLADWDALKSYQPPNPEKTNGIYSLDWSAERERAEMCKREGHLYGVGLPHGHTFLRMQDLCGFENLLVAFKLEEPEVLRVIEMVEAFNLGLLQRYVQLEPDMVALPEDLGMQTSLMISPDMFRQYIAPSYRRLTAVAGSRGAVIHQHSDGWILDLIDELVACGMHAINIQDMVNGIDNIARVLKGRVAIDLDIDRQNITVNGSPSEVRELIREEVAKLADPRGGLSFTYQPWAPTPLENVRALVESLQSYAVEDRDQVWRDVRH